MELQKTNQAPLDFRRWINYSLRQTDFHHIYALYRAVDKVAEHGSCSCVSEGDGYIVAWKDVEEKLELKDDDAREEFLSYLLAHYVPENDIQAWYEENLQAEEKNENHKNWTNSNGRENRERIKVNPHRKETFYYRLRLVFCLSVYVGLLTALVILIMYEVYYALVIAVVLGLLLFLMKRVMAGLFIGHIRGNSARIHERQYPVLYKLVVEQSAMLGIETPEIFIRDGPFNAWVTRFAGKNILMLYSEVLETALKGNYDVLKYIIGHELGHIQRRHLYNSFLLAPSHMMPLLVLAHCRGMEYTCDRIGYRFSPKGAMEGNLIIASGKAVYTKLNIESLLSEKRHDFWTWFSEKFSTHPHLINRVYELKRYSAFY